jgi:hypothetical protein
MFDFSLSSYTEHAKALLGALGVTAGLWVSYQQSGMPVPATQAYVESRFEAYVATQSEVIADITFLVLEGQMEQIDLRRAGLRSEKFNLERTVNTANPDPSARVTFERRLGQIADELTTLDRREQETMARLKDLKARKPGLKPSPSKLKALP